MGLGSSGIRPGDILVLDELSLFVLRKVPGWRRLKVKGSGQELDYLCI